MTKIEWTHAPGYQGETWNPATGCSKVSAGCKNCWAEGQFPRRYKRDGRVFTDVQFHPERLSQPLRWRKPRMVAVNLMGDLFHDAVPLGFIAKIFGVMAKAHWHRYLILTKRPVRMQQATQLIAAPLHGAARWVWHEARRQQWPKWYRGNGGPSRWPLPNVWIGVSVEDQATAGERIPLLRQTPAAVRFISGEPLIKPLDLDPPTLAGLDWVIVGGESGPKARDMDPDWARSIRDQCVAAGVPFFFKQMARKAPVPEDLMVREWPEHYADRTRDPKETT